MQFYLAARALLATTALAFSLSGCQVLRPDAHLAAFSTQLTGMNQVPSVATPATGHLDALLDKNTLLFRWKLSFKGLSGPATAGHFHGPAVIGANAGITLPFTGPINSPLEGRATLSPAQAAALQAGKWYVALHTAAHPTGEIRGQLILRE